MKQVGEDIGRLLEGAKIMLEALHQIKCVVVPDDGGDHRNLKLCIEEAKAALEKLGYK